MKKRQGYVASAIVVSALLLSGCAGMGQGGGELAITPTPTPPAAGGSPYAAGKQELANGRLGLALEHLRQAAQDDPGSVGKLNAVGVVYDRLGRHDLAMRYYQRALAIETRSAQTLNNIGYSYILQGKYDLALAYLEKAATLSAGTAHDATITRNLAFAQEEVSARERKAPEAPMAVDTQALPAPTVRLEREGVGQYSLTTRLVTSENLSGRRLPAASGLERGARYARYERWHAYPAAREPVESEALPPPPAGSALAAVPDKLPALAGEPQASPWPVERVRKTALPAVGEPAAIEASATAGEAAVVEVSNGAGRLHLARRFSRFLAERGVRVARLTNAESYDNARTVIFYRPGQKGMAEGLAGLLPVTVEVREADGQHADVRLRLGGDLLAYDASNLLPLTEEI